MQGVKTNDNKAADKMIEMFCEGYSIVQIAKAVYYSTPIVRKILREAEYDTGKYKGRRIRTDDPQTLEIVRLYQNGLSINKISGIVPMSGIMIRRRLIAAGVTMRPPGGYISEGTKKHIRELYTEGNSFYKIAKLCGVSIPTAAKYAKI